MPFLGAPVSTGTNKSSAGVESFATTSSVEGSIKFTSSYTSMDSHARTTNGMCSVGPDERGRRSIKDGNAVTEVVQCMYIPVILAHVCTMSSRACMCVCVRGCACVCVCVCVCVCHHALIYM